MQPEDLDKELERLWSRVSTAPGEVPAPPPSFLIDSQPTNSFNVETMALLKKQHNSQARHWAEMLETKERALAVYRDRQRALEIEVGTLRDNLRGAEARVTGEMLEAKSKLEAGFKSLEQERADHARERQAVESLLAATRERLANETARWKEMERQWEKREQQYLLDLKELQTKIAHHQEAASHSEEFTHKITGNMKEAKNALEKTLAELLLERKTREDAEKERATALRKVDEVEKHFSELSKIWEEERAQWRELWDRERSTWDAQRTEITGWEESLRKERETWHEELKGQEKNQLQFVSKVSETLRESAETTTKMASALKTFEQIKVVALESAAVDAAAKLSIFKRALGYWPRVAAVAAAAALIFMGVRYNQAPHFRRLSAQPLALENPTSMSYDGAALWVSDWGGTLSSFNPLKTEAPARLVKIESLGAYHPTALAFGGEFLWTLDAAQGRIIRHKAEDPSQVLQSRATPGPAPTGLAYDGQSIWSYDAANKIFYQHAADETNARSFGIKEDAVPTAMAWVGGKLWVFDSKSRDLLLYGLKDGALQLEARHAMTEQVVSMVAVGKELWVLAGPAVDRPGFALIKYKF